MKKKEFTPEQIITMLGMVLLSSIGLSFISLGRLEHYSHALAGARVCLCGIGVQLFGS